MGGAGNVLEMLLALDCSAILCGLVGQDAKADRERAVGGIEERDRVERARRRARGEQRDDLVVPRVALEVPEIGRAHV